MLTILGITISYEALVFFGLFLGSEAIGSSKLKENSIAQVFMSVVSYLKLIRKEDDKIQKIKDTLK